MIEVYAKARQAIGRGAHGPDGAGLVLFMKSK